MPIQNAKGDVLLFFSGENFADDADGVRLRSRGYQCDLDKASYLVHLYEETGISFIERLNGWFSGVLVDQQHQRTILFNDRYGLGRIYYHEKQGTIYFSSEAKSLLKVLPELRELDYASLGEAFSCGCVLQNRTLFPGISLVPGGSRWTFTGDREIKKERYFDHTTWEGQAVLDDAAFYERLKETFARILPRYVRGTTSPAMSLTGGLDGRMIMAWVKSRPGELPCYTFGGTYRDCADVRIARQVAKSCQQSHQTIVVGSPFFSEFPGLAEKTVYVSDGSMDVSGSVELYANRMARELAPVRLTGNYGSEILRGNVAFRPGSVNEDMLQPEFARLLRNAATTYVGERNCSDLSFIAFKQVPWHHYSRLSVELTQLTMRSPYLDNELVALMYQASPGLRQSAILALRLIADGNEVLASIPTDRGLLYRPIPIISTLCHYYEEFMVRAEYAYDYGMPQWLAKIDRPLGSLHIERLFLGRQKFYHFRVWYRDQLARYAQDVLLDPRTLARPYLNGRRVETIVRDHVTGRRNHTNEIHRLLTCELIQRQLVEMR
jgi:asparagine synthase (glutamine-hydrolysing)